MREGEAPSYFNPIEATALVDLVEGLINQHRQGAGRPAVSPNDIGVIATYRKQVYPRRPPSSLSTSLLPSRFTLCSRGRLSQLSIEIVMYLYISNQDPPYNSHSPNHTYSKFPGGFLVVRKSAVYRVLRVNTMKAR
jgi:hypothetical protein